MKSLFVAEIEKTAIRNVDKPIINQNEVLLNVDYVGICGSDFHVYKGLHAFRKPPVILGHEVTGTIVEIGANVTKAAIGDRVTILPQKSCKTCPMCRGGHEQQCQNKVVPGTQNWIGSFVEYFNAHEDLVFRLNNDVGTKTAVLAEPLAVAVHALSKIENDKRKNLLILGGGTIGILTLSTAKSMGFEKIIVTDIVEYNLQAAKENGADRVVNVLNENLDMVILEEFGKEKSDSVIITAGAPNVLEQAITNVGTLGTIVYISMITKPLTFDTYPIVFKEIKLIGSLTYNEKDFALALQIIEGDVKRFEKLITHCYESDKVQDAFEMIDGRKEGFVKVVIKM